MKYPAVLHKDKNSDYGVTIPDLPGCFSAGETFEKALENAEEAILCHIEGLMEDSADLPAILPIEKHKKNHQFKNGVWAIVDVNLEKLAGKAKRVNITISERILSKIDEYVASKGETRSGFLAQAALEYIYEHNISKKG